MRQTSFIAVLLGSAFAGLSVQASAEDGGTHYALNRLDPAPAGDAFFGVPSAEAHGVLAIRAMVFADYQERPLDVTTLNTGSFMSSVVRYQALLHGNVSVALFDRALVGVDFPAVLQSGDGFASGTTSLPAPQTTGTGNVRLSGRGRIWSEPRGLVHVGVGGYVFLPTTGDYASDAGLRGWVHAVANGEALNRLRYAVAVGPEFREDRELLGVNQGSRLTYSAGVAALLGSKREFQVGPEVLGTVSFNAPDARSTNLDVLVGGRYHFLEEFTVGVGAGTALSAGLGSPLVRGMLSFTWSPAIEVAKNAPPIDGDGDRVLDANDACPERAGVATDDPKTNGCPVLALVLDGDSDGVPDAIDACPTTVGIVSAEPKTNGCPLLALLLDGDGDGVPDAIDACATTAGVVTAAPKTNGCPLAVEPDAYGDGVGDEAAACPPEAGADPTKPAEPGCSVSKRLDHAALGIGFEVGTMALTATSDAAIDAVATLLKNHPELVKVEAQFHTDNQVNPRIGKVLSQERAGAVLRALVKRGVPAARLVAKGYGDELPVAGNTRPESPQKNGRVQFLVLEKK